MHVSGIIRIFANEVGRTRSAEEASCSKLAEENLRHYLYYKVSIEQIMNKKLLTLFICLLPMALLAGSGDVNDDGKINVADIVESG